jgi:hypothetical protein
MDSHIYDGSEQHINPQLMFADPNTVFARTAGAHGISTVMLYIYPPTLADLLVPLTLFSPVTALIIWNLLNLVMILSVSVMLTRMLDMQVFRWAGFIAVFLVIFRPTLNSLHWGQVSILLLFLVMTGLSLYAYRQKNMAGLMFALAGAIKLLPLILVVPLFAWRDWKSLRAIAVWGAVIVGALWLVNGSGTLNLYFLHQLPSMSTGILGGADFSNNRSLGNVFYAFRRSQHLISPGGLVCVGRLVSASVLCYAGWLSQLKHEDMLPDNQRPEMIFMFLLLSACQSPYSWLYTYVLGAPAVVTLGKRIFERRSNAVETILLMSFLLSLSTTKFHMPMATPLLGILLGIMGLHRLRAERSLEIAKDPATEVTPILASC